MPSRSTQFRRDVFVQKITRWKDVAALLEQGWRVDGFDLVSPAGERRPAWGNAIKACRDRGLIAVEGPTEREKIEMGVTPDTRDHEAR